MDVIRMSVQNLENVMQTRQTLIVWDVKGQQNAMILRQESSVKETSHFKFLAATKK